MILAMNKYGWHTSILSFIVAFLLVLVYTNAWWFPAYYAGARTSTSVHIVLMIILSIYLLSEIGLIVKVLHKKAVAYWILVTVFIPIVLLLFHYVLGYIAPDNFVRRIGLILYYAIIFLASIIAAIRSSVKVYLFFVAVIILMAAGFIFSLMYPFLTHTIQQSFVAEDMAMSGHKWWRSSGFFANPNNAALTSVIAIIGLIVVKNHCFEILRHFLIGMAFCLVFFTGSRTSIVALFILIIVILLSSFFNKRKYRIRLNKFLIGFASLIIILLTSYLAISSLAGSNMAVERTVDRVTAIPNLLVTQSETTDGSMHIRISQLTSYVNQVLSHPIIGRSPQVLRELTDKGNFSHASQNSWINWSLSYGIIYAVLIALLLGCLLRSSVKHNRLHLSDGSRLIILMFPILLVYSLSIDHLLNQECVIINFGIALGLIIREQRRLSLIQLGDKTTRDHRAKAYSAT